MKMQFRSRWFLEKSVLIVLALSLAFPRVQVSGAQGAVVTESIGVDLSMPRYEYAMGEPIAISIKYTNNSSDVLMLLGQPVWNELKLTLVRNGNEEIKPSDCPCGPMVSSLRPLTVFKPRQSIQEGFAANTPRTLFPLAYWGYRSPLQPGHYTLTAIPVHLGGHLQADRTTFQADVRAASKPLSFDVM